MSSDLKRHGFTWTGPMCRCRPHEDFAFYVQTSQSYGFLYRLHCRIPFSPGFPASKPAQDMSSFMLNMLEQGRPIMEPKPRYCVLAFVRLVGCNLGQSVWQVRSGNGCANDAIIEPFDGMPRAIIQPKAQKGRFDNIKSGPEYSGCRQRPEKAGRTDGRAACERN